MNWPPGIAGTLFPGHFLASGLAEITALPDRPAPDAEFRRRLRAWWRRVDETCGSATGLRALFDLAAMPLVALLGFRAHDAVFDRAHASARLSTRRGTAVALLVLPWASRPSRVWRPVADTCRHTGADWCLIFSPPFLTLVDGRGHAMRRGLDFTLPDALHDASVPILWLLCRGGAFDRGQAPGGIETTLLDLLSARAERFQDSVRQDLQAGVVRALAAVSSVLDSRRKTGVMPFDEALTLIYRMLFLLFAESRGLLPHRHPVYGPAYGLGTLCREAADGQSVPGLWDGMAAITRLSRAGCDTGDLIVRPFNGRLFARASAPSLEKRSAARVTTSTSRRKDAAIAAALAALATRRGRAGREEISYADLGVEQLGAVYERVLDLDPDAIGDVDVSPGAGPVHRHSRRRKETGTFYTPQPLAEFVVRRTLAPLVRGATADDILNLRIIDPAMGSGAFLVAACRFLARAYETALVDEGRCAETDLTDSERANIRRTIAGRCLTGVDSNPVAVQLARLSLWLATLARDKPLTFLDHRLRAGNSLLGTSPDDLWRVSSRGTRRGSTDGPTLLDAAGLEGAIREIARPLRQLREGCDDTVGDVRARERLWTAVSGDRSPLAPWRMACDLWAARWFWPSAGAQGAPSPAETAALIDMVVHGDRTLGVDRLRHRLTTAREVAEAQRFFHWPLEFADVFYADRGEPRERPGFDAVIGNPPWEVLGHSHRQTLAFLRQSGQYPSCNRGHLNLYQAFVDRSLSIVRRGGRVGLILPWGLASDEGSRSLRSRLFGGGAVDSLVGLDNAGGIFPIHRGLRFVVLVATPGTTGRDARARFGVRRVEELDELPGEDEPGDRSAFPVRLSPETIRRIGGPGLRIPDVRRPADLDWLTRIFQTFAALGDPGGWAATFGRELNATEDRDSFGADGLPVIEGKHLNPFSIDVTQSSQCIAARDASRLLPDRRFGRDRLGYRDVSAATNRQALIAAIVPANVLSTHTIFCLRTPLDLERQHFLCGLFNSATVNRIVRMLMGGHLTTALVETLPIPMWTASAEQRRVADLSRRLATMPADTKALDELNALVTAMYPAE
ncbi:MAG TPA: N-6 DNA methylase [Vicinamibacterales bacterium]|nr:N-6 DNA methylase [Vicinamibacterales bacterium]